MILMVFAFSNILKVNTLRAPIQTSYYTDSFYREHSHLDPNEVIQPSKIFAFGLGSSLVDPSIGRFVAKQVFFDRATGLSQTSDIPIVPCYQTNYGA